MIIAAVAASGLALCSIDRIDRRIDSLDSRMSRLERVMDRRVSTLEGYLLRHVFSGTPPPQD
ncbi:MAG: hypothetical protein OXM03_13260 [Chloroflexota bacterium]|nr:hypothetical protein [Chloroflexota bacterium]MDE2841589.1 hypothetical protein [Chloroflexota bacterium]MDE2929554.1 hypothetical protein [Chloroflexota bacterium]